MTDTTIVVGVTARQPASFATAAVEFALRLNAELLFVQVDTTRFPIETTARGHVVAESFDSDALMIIVGTRASTVRDTLRELVSGPVASALAHHQSRPVLVLPFFPSDDHLVDVSLLPREGE